MILYIKLSVYVTRKDASGVEKRRNVGLATNSTFFFTFLTPYLGISSFTYTTTKEGCYSIALLG